LWCGRILSDKEIVLDHVVPLSRGGEHSHRNLRVACRPCNTRKSDWLLSELPNLTMPTLFA
jgi:5-methylcytosine-specific restriction endonuclease McrA